MLSRDELRTMKVDDRGGDAPEVNSGAATNSAALANGARAAVNGHGWAMVAVDGRPALGRSHPLTVEGDDVGAFELNFACGEQGRDYIVTYVEQRRGDEAGRAPAALSEVEISLAGKPMQLKVVASRPRDKSTELVSIASGRMLGRDAEGLCRHRQPLADGGDRKRRRGRRRSGSAMPGSRGCCRRWRQAAPRRRSRRSATPPATARGRAASGTVAFEPAKKN